jgi:hypothetical protein
MQLLFHWWLTLSKSEVHIHKELGMVSFWPMCDMWNYTIIQRGATIEPIYFACQ